MSERKWTKGPWVIERNESCVVICARGKSIAAVWPTSLGIPQNLPMEENSHLIASAPELYEALKEALNYVNEYAVQMSSYNVSDRARACASRIRAALQRAEGES
jgi:hypothetical protein